MNKLLTLFFTLAILNAYAQTEIKEKKYKMTYSDNNACYAFDYDITVPHLIVTDDKDIRAKVNDSIKAIVKAYFPFFSFGFMPELDYSGSDCDPVSFRPDIAEMTYKVTLNTKQFLSITVSNHLEAGGGGHGGGTMNHYFNIDLVNNKLVTLDSLFSPVNKVKLLQLIKTKFDKEQNQTFDSYEGTLELDGISISDTTFAAHYSVYAAHSVTWLYDVELPSAEIKKLLLKKYSWLYANGAKK